MLIGRARELDAIEHVLATALSGRGSLRLLCGEAGIGKTRLADEADARARARGFAVAWGRAWETGGAPAYWPWIEVLGALQPLGVELPPRAATLLGNDAAAAPGDRTLADPARERFELFDQVAGFVRECSRRTPVFLVLDDLHAADLASLELLSFVARGLRTSRIVILGAQRDAESRLAPVVEVLLRIEREGEVLALSPLSTEDVAEVVRQNTGRFDGALAVTLHGLTEGNPLFLREALRVVAGARGAPLEALRGMSAFDGVLALARGRFADADDATRATLGLAAVGGREVSLRMLVEVRGEPPEVVRTRLDTATARGLLVRHDDDHWTFSHVLVREAFYRDLSPERRRELHASIATVLGRWVRAGAEDHLATLAHHALSALPAGDPHEALRTAIRAADRARSQLAYEEAIALLERAHSTCGALGVDPRERIEVELALGWALTEGGKLSPGREVFRRAAELARTIPDARLLARAALGQGGAYVFGETRGELVELLREALQGLPAAEVEDARLRARLLSRLSAALTPSVTPEEPLALARDALRMIEDETDIRVRIDVGVAAGSALVDFAPPAERVPVNERLLADARSAGDRVLRLRALTRLACDYLARGEVSNADAAITARVALADSLGYPRCRWQSALLRSMRAMPDGRFDDCEAELAEARKIAADAPEANIAYCLELHRFWTMLVAGRTEGLREQAALTCAQVAKHLYDGAFAWAAAVAQAHLGERDAAGKALGAFPLMGPSRAIMSRLTLAETAVLCGTRSLYEALFATFALDDDTNATWGPIAFVCGPPVARVVGMMSCALGRPEEGARQFARALALAERMNAPASRAWVHLACGEGLAGDAASSEHLERALALAEKLGMPEVAARACAGLSAVSSRPVARAAAAAPEAPAASESVVAPDSAAPRFSIRRDGADWKIEHAGSSCRLKDMRGLAMLAQLVASPGREIRAVDLVSGAAGDATVDTGDSGEVIDARARDAYKKRILELRVEVEEAERDADLGRAARLRYELDALTDQIAAAVGLGGRERRVGSNAERARVSAQRRIREAIQKIADVDAPLGRHLEWTVRTGAFCAYEPGGRGKSR